MADKREADTLEGQFLIAMPNMADGRFEQSVIYLCSHSNDQGAMGLVLNQTTRQLSFQDLLVQLNVLENEEAIALPTDIRDMEVHKGGPVEMERGFVLHSNDFMIENATVPISGGICLTATLEILKAMAEGRGPKEAILALGYSGWGPGQLESEIQANGWLTGPADPEIVFDPDNSRKWLKALARIGIDPALLSGEAGHA